MKSANSGIDTRARLATALSACLLIGLGASAQAANAPGAPSVRVNYHDLDLTTPAGSQALYRRIQSAARSVCAPEDIRVLVEVAAASACESVAIARAVREVNSPQLAAVHSARQPQG